MHRNPISFAITILCLILNFSCSGKHEKETDLNNLDLVPINTPLIIIWGENGLVKVIQSSDTDTHVSFNDFNGNGNQFWFIEKRKKGYIIRSYLNKKVLSINLRDSSLIQQTFTGNKNQFWSISGKKDSVRIMSKTLNKYLTIELNNDIGLENYLPIMTQQFSLQSIKKIQEELDSCNCSENFEFIKNKIESSYSGFQDKVNPNTKGAYDELLAQTEKTAKIANNTVWCYKAINEYLKFFNDKHISFSKMVSLSDLNNANRFKSKLKKNDPITGFSLKNIDDSTLVLKLPSFNNDYKNIIDELINKNREKIINTPYLLIDIRHNGGGVDGTFSSILPLLYTNPYFDYGTEIIASPDHIKAYEAALKSLKIIKHSEYVDFYEKVLSRMKKNPGKFVLRTEDRLVKLDSVTPNPRKIGILINRRSASSAEEFLLNARESKKVVLFGQPTSGTLDYSSVFIVRCPSMVFKFGYATTRSRRLPKFSIDRDKIQPNIYLNDSVDWIEVAVRHLRNSR